MEGRIWGRPGKAVAVGVSVLTLKRPLPKVVGKVLCQRPSRSCFQWPLLRPHCSCPLPICLSPPQSCLDTGVVLAAGRPPVRLRGSQTTSELKKSLAAGLPAWDSLLSGRCPASVCPSPSSMVIRDLTLRSAASFGSFHLIRLLYDEYMFYLVEHRVAEATGETPIAVMGEVKGPLLRGPREGEGKGQPAGMRARHSEHDTVDT